TTVNEIKVPLLSNARLRNPVAVVIRGSTDCMAGWIVLHEFSGGP
ncbi:MAG: hypothetical protein QOJ58_4656, partial [Alphaproteobacteria bacterium]|nr:hypothetical protein [Alphaproteobacteria bacterium]